MGAQIRVVLQGRTTRSSQWSYVPWSTLRIWPVVTVSVIEIVVMVIKDPYRDYYPCPRVQESSFDSTYGCSSTIPGKLLSSICLIPWEKRKHVFSSDRFPAKPGGGNHKTKRGKVINLHCSKNGSCLYPLSRRFPWLRASLFPNSARPEGRRFLVTSHCCSFSLAIFSSECKYKRRCQFPRKTCPPERSRHSTKDDFLSLGNPQLFGSQSINVHVQLQKSGQRDKVRSLICQQISIGCPNMPQRNDGLRLFFAPACGPQASMMDYAMVKKNTLRFAQIWITNLKPDNLLRFWLVLLLRVRYHQVRMVW